MNIHIYIYTFNGDVSVCLVCLVGRVLRGLVRIQALFRGRRARTLSLYLRESRAAARIQATWRMRQQRHNFVRLKRATVLTQLRQTQHSSFSCCICCCCCCSCICPNNTLIQSPFLIFSLHIFSSCSHLLVAPLFSRWKRLVAIRQLRRLKAEARDVAGLVKLVQVSLSPSQSASVSLSLSLSDSLSVSLTVCVSRLPPSICSMPHRAPISAAVAPAATDGAV